MIRAFPAAICSRVMREAGILLVGGLTIAVILNLVFPGAKLKRPSSPPTRPALSLGDEIRIPGVTFDSQEETLVIFCSATCPVCRANLGLHSRLIRESARRSKPFLVILPEGQDAEGYLSSLGCDRRQGKTANLGRLGVSQTPTMGWIDPHGVVTSLRVGIKPGTAPEPFISKVLASEFPRSIPRMDDRDLQQLRSKKKPFQLLDLQDRIDFKKARREGAVNIPEEELEARSRIELNPRELLVVDCSPAPGLACQLAINVLRQSGFTQLAALNQKPRIFDSAAAPAEIGEPK